MSATAMIVFFILCMCIGLGRSYTCLLDVLRIRHSCLERGRIEVIVLHNARKGIVVGLLHIFRHIDTELLGVGDSDLDLVPVRGKLLCLFLGVDILGVREVTDRFLHGLADGTFLRILCREATEIITG